MKLHVSPRTLSNTSSATLRMATRAPRSKEPSRRFFSYLDLQHSADLLDFMFGAPQVRLLAQGTYGAANGELRNSHTAGNQIEKGRIL